MDFKRHYLITLLILFLMISCFDSTKEYADDDQLETKMIINKSYDNKTILSDGLSIKIQKDIKAVATRYGFIDSDIIFFSEPHRGENNDYKNIYYKYYLKNNIKKAFLEVERKLSGFFYTNSYNNKLLYYLGDFYERSRLQLFDFEDESFTDLSSIIPGIYKQKAYIDQSSNGDRIIYQSAGTDKSDLKIYRKNIKTGRQELIRNGFIVDYNGGLLLYTDELFEGGRNFSGKVLDLKTNTEASINFPEIGDVTTYHDLRIAGDRKIIATTSSNQAFLLDYNGNKNEIKVDDNIRIIYYVYDMNSDLFLINYRNENDDSDGLFLATIEEVK